ncbi:MAG TPA: hypothetical protein DCE20_09010 [Gammaproteobacteria bacterium]|nr:hypothetical protein [Gammaproteobacteria bacterium]
MGLIELPGFRSVPDRVTHSPRRPFDHHSTWAISTDCRPAFTAQKPPTTIKRLACHAKIGWGANTLIQAL